MHYALASGLEEDQTRWELQKRLAELSMSHLDEVDKIREGRGACSLDTGELIHENTNVLFVSMDNIAATVAVHLSLCNGVVGRGA